MNITININAPELAEAIQALASALQPGSVNLDSTKLSQLIADGPGVSPVEKAEEKETAPEKPVDAPAEKEEKKEETKPTIGLEVVRKKLAALAQEGKQAEVKALFESFGASRLSNIDPKDYQELLTKAEAL